MHIVFVSREYIPSLHGGGIASYISDMAKALFAEGNRVTVITASDDTRSSSNTEEDGVRVIRLSGGDFIVESIEGRNPIKQFRCMYRFYSYRLKVIRALQQIPDADIVEFAEYGAEAYYMNRLALPYVIRLHTPSLFDRDTQSSKKFRLTRFHKHWCGLQEIRVLRKARYITSCSQSLKDWVVRFLPVLPENIKVINNFIDPNIWHPAETEGKTNPIHRILFAGTLVESKGMGDVINACSLINRNGVRVELLLVGKVSNYSQRMQETCKKRHWSWCRILGKVSRAKLLNLYQSCDISCFPSWWENFPLVCLEAMATGAIVIGSDAGGMSEIISDGEDGFLVPPKTPQLLAEKIEYIIGLPDAECRRITLKAVEKIRTRFSNKVIVPQMLEYYMNVIRENTP